MWQSRVTGMFEHLQTRATSLVRILLSYSVISTMVGIVIVAVFRCAMECNLLWWPTRSGRTNNNKGACDDLGRREFSGDLVLLQP